MYWLPSTRSCKCSHCIIAHLLPFIGGITVLPGLAVSSGSLSRLLSLPLVVDSIAIVMTTDRATDCFKKDLTGTIDLSQKVWPWAWFQLRILETRVVTWVGTNRILLLSS